MQKLIGVVFKPARFDGRPFPNAYRSQIAVGGKVYHLGFTDDGEEAARAFDNAAYYLAKQGYRRPTRLNFPEDYREAPQEIFPSTAKVLADCEKRGVAKPGLEARVAFSCPAEVAAWFQEAIKTFEGVSAQVLTLRDRMLIVSSRLSPEHNNLKEIFDSYVEGIHHEDEAVRTTSHTALVEFLEQHPEFKGAAALAEFREQQAR